MIIKRIEVEITSIRMNIEVKIFKNLISCAKFCEFTHRQAEECPAMTGMPVSYLPGLSKLMTANGPPPPYKHQVGQSIILRLNEPKCTLLIAS